MWSAQHEPVLLENGNILIFDNRGPGGSSRVLEFDPFTLEIVWQYEGTSSHPFYSELLGTNQRLPNGNTLITESKRGRVFEVTPENELVWEYRNPFLTGKYKNLVAIILHMDRYNRSDLEWLTSDS
ncbi:arylsulfotransferase family protein, partial [Candidatus Altiarchaeota archaeon]